jgi:hypothetical protein
VFQTVDEQPPDTAATVPGTHCEVADMPVDIFPGIFKTADYKPDHPAVTDSDKIGRRKIGKGFVEGSLFPRVDKRFLFDGENCPDI